MSVNDCADELLTRIQTSIDNSLKAVPSLRSAIIASVNQDKTVNVYLPPDNTKVFTRISNQTPFELNPGDSVELFLKDGFSNCWVCAKHQTSADMKNMIKEVIYEVLRENKLI